MLFNKLLLGTSRVPRKNSDTIFQVVDVHQFSPEKAYLNNALTGGLNTSGLGYFCYQRIQFRVKNMKSILIRHYHSTAYTYMFYVKNDTTGVNAITLYTPDGEKVTNMYFKSTSESNMVGTTTVLNTEIDLASIVPKGEENLISVYMLGPNPEDNLDYTTSGMFYAIPQLNIYQSTQGYTLKDNLIYAENPNSLTLPDGDTLANKHSLVNHAMVGIVIKRANVTTTSGITLYQVAWQRGSNYMDFIGQNDWWGETSYNRMPKTGEYLSRLALDSPQPQIPNSSGSNLNTLATVPDFSLVEGGIINPNESNNTDLNDNFVSYAIFSWAISFMTSGKITKNNQAITNNVNIFTPDYPQCDTIFYMDNESTGIGDPINRSLTLPQ